MSSFQMPITINDAMLHINNNEYLLPAFQREFVWEAEQIERLFDSLMRDFPTSSMLFWKVKGQTRTRWKFYKFIDSFVYKASDYSKTNELFNTANSNDFYAILDGQQRLTAIRIGLYGTYSYHEYRKSWTYSNDNFPARRLYLNLSQKGGDEDDCEYFFNFKKNSDTAEKDFYRDEKDQLWFKVGAVIGLGNSGYDVGDYFKDIALDIDQKQIIGKLRKIIFTDRVITYYEEDSQNPDVAVKIFTRINSGGTFLSFSDIVFSLMVANWSNRDARTEIDDLINLVGQKGFKIDKSYVVKAVLYLYHPSVKTEINSFDKDFCELVESKWDKIESCILSLFDLLRNYGLTSFTLTSNNATLPILYYLYHTDKYPDFTNKVNFDSERKEIKKWLYSVILRKTFGGHSDTVLQQTRKAFTEDISQKYIDVNFIFDGELINNNIKNWGPVNDEELDELLSVQKDHYYAFTILSLLYPNLDYKNNNFHKDHLHAENLYKNLDQALKDKYTFKVYNSILNLQMLDKNENESKSNKPLDIWVEETCKTGTLRENFLKAHLIPNVDLSLNNFEMFIEERKKMLKEKLKEILS